MGYASNGTWTSDYSGAEIDALLGQVNNGITPLIGKGINLLDNWYFVGGGTDGKFPINQRGITYYDGATYIFDRWRSTANTTVTLGADGVTFAKKSGASGNGVFYCTQPEEARVVNVPVTLSVLVDSISGTARMDMNGHPFGMSRYLEVGMNSETFTVPDADYYVGIYPAIDVTGSVKIRAVKLEIGTQQTLARQVNGTWVLNDPAPNYQQELAKCQRYLQVFLKSYNAGLYANWQTTNAAGLLLKLANPMRRNGAGAKIVNAFTARCAIPTGSYKDIAIAADASVQINNGEARIPFTGDGSLTVGAWGSIDNDILISDEL